MSFDDYSAREDLRLTPRHYFWIAVLFGVVVLGAVIANRVLGIGAQIPQATPAVVKASGASAAVVEAGPQWQELSVAQKKILQPLASTWNSLGYGHKNKWIALASNYPNRTPEDQAKLQSRMAEWSALTPGARERARLNFAETKKLHASTRAAEWAAYQELSDEEKQTLGEKRRAKPTGAAVAVTTGANDKLTAVPITRRTVQPQDSSAAVKPQIDPNTLLPKAIAPASVASAASTADSQVTPASDRSSTVINIDTLSPN